jgi:hypothetical protein
LSHAREISPGIAIDMAAKGDVDMADAIPKAQGPNDVADLLQTNHNDAFAFSHTEALALELYDQLQELELQRSLLEAQQSGRHYAGTWRLWTLTNLAAAHVHDVSALSDDAVQEQLTIAQDEVVKAKAEYEIRNRISHNVLVMDPVLKAVHGGEKTGFAEK